MERVLVLALMCAADYKVSATQLVWQLWESDPDSGGPATLRSHVAHVRQALRAVARAGDGRAGLITERVRGGVQYRLHVQPERVDAVRFEREVQEGRILLRQGQYERTEARLSNALRLWRGMPFADAVGWSFPHEETTRLRNLWRDLRIARAEACAASGRDGEVIDDLRNLAAERPGDGRAWVLLITCLYRCERDEEAALACRRAIEAFAARGIETARLEKMQRAVLNGSLPRSFHAIPR
jgi:DNA-binding SARP family transcriptional activator